MNSLKRCQKKVEREKILTSTAAKQGRIGSIHDGINLKLGDISSPRHKERKKKRIDKWVGEAGLSKRSLLKKPIKINRDHVRIFHLEMILSGFTRVYPKRLRDSNSESSF